MAQSEFTNIQEALLWVFGPMIMWWFAAFVALGLFSGTSHIWFGFLKWITRKG